MIIDTTDITRARKEIDRAYSRNENITIIGKDIEFNRLILENRKVNRLILDLSVGRDRLYQRDSGLNHILIKIAKQNKIELAINFSQIINKTKKEKAIIIARLIQNLKLAKKVKYPIKIINTMGKDKYDLRSFLLTIGFPTDLIKKCFD